MVNFNSAPYSHLHSLQGDVAGIVDYAESLVVEYKYDPWGKPILARVSTDAHEALPELNRFRHSEYAWDEEVERFTRSTEDAISGTSAFCKVLAVDGKGNTGRIDLLNRTSGGIAERRTRR